MTELQERPRPRARIVGLLILILLVTFLALPVTLAAAADVIAMRNGVNLGLRPDGLGERFRWATTRSAVWTNVPKMSVNFVTEGPESTVAVSFSADAYVDSAGKRMFLRALIDGTAASPADVVFTSETTGGLRSFTFVGRVGAGIHTLEIQWLVDAGGIAYLKDAGLLVRKGSLAADAGSLVALAPASGPSLEISDGAWTDLPGLAGSVETRSGEVLTLNASAECSTSPERSLYLRVLVDGEVAEPTNVTFARGTRAQVRSMTFGARDLPAGRHDVRVQALAQAGGRGFVGDRTLVLSALPSGSYSATPAQRFMAPASGPAIFTTRTDFQPIPGLEGLIFLPDHGEISVAFHAESEVVGEGRISVRLVLGYEGVARNTVELMRGGQQGVSSYLFSLKGLQPGELGGFYWLRMEWRIEGGGTAYMGDRAVSIISQQGTLPDLAQPPPFGQGNSLLEPARGNRRLLTILWDPARPAPDDVAPEPEELEETLFGATQSVQDYYDKISGGRLRLENVGVLGGYSSREPWEHYFVDHPECEEPGSDGFTGGHQEKWVEALEQADQEFDFSGYDDNGDGFLDPHELAVLIVIPQSQAAGFTRPLRPYCSGELLRADGVVIPALSEWYTSLSTFYEYNVAAHELAHLILNLDDMYVSDLATTPGRASLMGVSQDATSHIDGVNKLALGWVTPEVLRTWGAYALDDVKHSQRVLVLPRRRGGVGEYFLLENRRTSVSDPLYDERIYDSGIAIWHVVEDPPVSEEGEPIPPSCVSQEAWEPAVGKNARQGIRLLRPRIRFSNSQAFWSSGHYDLLDHGLICPADGDVPANRRNALIWADGTPSGYQVRNWSENGSIGWFDLMIDP